MAEKKFTNVVIDQASDEKLDKLSEMFKYTIWGWQDTEDDEGKTLIGFTDEETVYYKVIWDWDYFEMVDNVTGEVMVPRVRNDDGDLA